MAVVVVPPEADCCPVSGHSPALCPPSAALRPPAACRRGDKSLPPPAGYSFSRTAGRRRRARKPPREAPERPFGSCSVHVSWPPMHVQPAWPPGAARHTRALVGTFHHTEGPAEGILPPRLGAHGGCTPTRACGRFHPATRGAATCPACGRCGRAEHCPARACTTALGRAAAPDFAASIPAGDEPTTPWPGAAPHRSGPRRRDGRGPRPRRLATRPHSLRRVQATRGGTRRIPDTPGPVGSWRPMAACSIRAHGVPGLSRRTPAPLRASARASGYTTAPALRRGRAAACGAPARSACRQGPGGLCRPGPDHDTLRRDSALRCAQALRAVGCAAKAPAGAPSP
jgi:hypothetical protein